MNEKTPEQIDAERAVTLAVQEARTLQITTAGDFQAAGNVLLSIKAAAKRVENVFGPVVKAAHAAWKQATATREQFLAPLNEAESRVKRAMVSYEQAERERAERERAAAEEAARKAADEQRLREAVAVEQVAGPEAAQAVLEAPMPAVTLPPAPPPTKASGVSFRDVYTAEVYDLRVLAAAIAAGQQPTTLIQANTTVINQMARALKGAFAVPGVRVIVTRTAAAAATAER